MYRSIDSRMSTCRYQMHPVHISDLQKLQIAESDIPFFIMDRKGFFLLTFLLLSVFSMFVSGYFVCLLFVETGPDREQIISNEVSKITTYLFVQKEKLDECIFYLRRMEQFERQLESELEHRETEVHGRKLCLKICHQPVVNQREDGYGETNDFESRLVDWVHSDPPPLGPN